MRLGYVGKGSGAVAPGTLVSTLTVPADMVAADVLLEVASLGYLYDTTALVPNYMTSARSHAAGSAGQRFGPHLPMLANGSTYDPQTNNLAGTLLASAARTAIGTSADQTNYNGRGARVFLNVSVASGTGGLQPILEVKDPVSGVYFQMGASPGAVTATGSYAYTYYPGAASTGGNIQQTLQFPVGRTWRVRVLVGDASSYTYSLGYEAIL